MCPCPTGCDGLPVVLLIRSGRLGLATGVVDGACPCLAGWDGPGVGLGLLIVLGLLVMMSILGLGLARLVLKLLRGGLLVRGERMTGILVKTVLLLLLDVSVLLLLDGSCLAGILAVLVLLMVGLVLLLSLSLTILMSLIIIMALMLGLIMGVVLLLGVGCISLVQTRIELLLKADSTLQSMLTPEWLLGTTLQMLLILVRLFLVKVLLPLGSLASRLLLLLTLGAILNRGRTVCMTVSLLPLLRSCLVSVLLARCPWFGRGLRESERLLAS